VLVDLALLPTKAKTPEKGEVLAVQIAQHPTQYPDQAVRKRTYAQGRRSGSISVDKHALNNKP